MPRAMRIPVCLLSFALLSSAASAQTIQINRDNKTIAISTTDEATATADIAAITVGFEVYGPDSQSTYTDAGKLSQAILQVLHRAGVDDKNIESQTQGLLKNTTFDEKEARSAREGAIRLSAIVGSFGTHAERGASNPPRHCRRRQQDRRHRLAPLQQKIASSKSGRSRLGEGAQGCISDG
jgi:hypothetical protein